MGRVPDKRPTAEQALQILQEGNRRFVAAKQQQSNHVRKNSAKSPERQVTIATVLTCSDSPISPVDIFDQSIGDLFVVRVASNIIGLHSLGSIEYAVQNLKTPLIIVMGHSCCDTIKDVVNKLTLKGHMASFTIPLQTAITKVKDMQGELVDNAAKEVAIMIAMQIAAFKPIISDFVKGNKLKVMPAYHDVMTGEVMLL